MGTRSLRHCEIRRHPSIAGIPAAAVAALASDEDRVRALRAGFHLHIAKPVDSAALVHAVDSLAGSGRTHV